MILEGSHRFAGSARRGGHFLARLALGAVAALALAAGCNTPQAAGRADGTSCRADSECASGFCRCASSCRSGCCAPAEKRGDTVCTMDCTDLRCPNGD